MATNPWFVFQFRAMAVLRSPSEQSGWGTRTLIHLIEAPSFENARSWEIQNEGLPGEDGVQYRVITRTWRDDLDYPPEETVEALSEQAGHDFALEFSRLLPQSPTIETTFCEIAAEIVDPVVERVRSLRLPPLVSREDDVVVLDGTCYEVIVGGFCESASFRWSNDGPIPWRKLTVRTEQLIKVLRQTEPTPDVDTH